MDLQIIKSSAQKALKVVRMSERFDEDALVVAQKIGLQGEKRRLRYRSSENHVLANKLRTRVYDDFGVSIDNEYKDTPMPAVGAPKEFFKTVLDKMIEEYSALHDVGNSLVSAGARPLASLIYNKCETLIDDIAYYRRTILEGELCGWSHDWLFMHQTTAENVHDNFEKKEKI